MIEDIPNTSENSLEDVQQTFESRNKLIINSTTIGTGEATPKRNIIRGGSRIEPILYTQYGHSPALWNVTASFSGDFVTDLSTIHNTTTTSIISATNFCLPVMAPCFSRSFLISPTASLKSLTSGLNNRGRINAITTDIHTV